MDQPTKETLVAAARAALDNAYAPYSRFDVGAAILDTNGTIHVGVNVENAVYPVGVCAERAAICVAVSAGVTDFVALALATRTDKPVSPCGMCRQAIVEFSADLPLLLATEQGPWVETTLDQILPHQFSATYLPEK